MTDAGQIERRTRLVPEPEYSASDGFVTTTRRKPRPDSVARTGEVAGEVAGEVTKLVLVCRGAMSRTELQQTLFLKGADNFRRLYLVPALEAGFIEMTIPDKPNSRLQKYRLTAKGAALLARLKRP